MSQRDRPGTSPSPIMGGIRGPLPAEDVDDVVRRVGADWSSLNEGRLFLTGATGFFGQWILSSFCRACDLGRHTAEVVALSRRPREFAQRAPWIASHPAVTWIEGDVRTFSRPEGPFSHVLHAATDSSGQPGTEDPWETLQTIVEGTARVCELAASAKARRFLFTSSGAIYGRQSSDCSRISEDEMGILDPLDPKGAYAEGKRAAEALTGAHSARHGYEAIVARCFAFLGPGMAFDAHFAAGNFLRDSHRGKPIVIQGDGTPLRSYFYPTDLAVWLWTLLFRGRQGRAYNVGSEDAVSIGDLAARIAALAPRPTAVEIMKAPLGGPPSRYVPSTRRAREELGLHQIVGLDDAIQRSFAWLQRTEPG